MINLKNHLLLIVCINLCCTLSINAQCNNSNKKVGALIAYGSDNGEKTPLILIHGIHGTAPNERRNEKRTEANQYWNEFKAKYVGDKDLTSKYVIYDFQYYSNRESVQDIACELGSFIDEKIPDRQHVILAQSMGGLVAKAYMVFYPHKTGNWAGMKGGDTLIGAITLATPHHGTHGSNDVNALKQHIVFGWKQVIDKLNFAYWSDRAGFFSPQSLASGMPNRGDLRWDNYDGAIRQNSLTNNDVNIWLPTANKNFEQFSAKVILYAGAMRLENIANSPQSALAQAVGNPIYNDHQRLSFANDVLLNGFSSKFGSTDGLVPYQSALLCNTPPNNKATPNFICDSKYKVRRFEQGRADASPNEMPDANTLSIDRIPRGFDHKDMYEHPYVLDHVIFDLKNFTENKVPLPSAKIKIIYYRENPSQISVPDNWQAYETAGSVIFAPPQGAYSSSGFTHGAMMGIVQTGNNLLQATEEYVSGLLQTNEYLRQKTDFSPTSIGGRSAFVTVLSGKSPVTGKIEIVNFYSTQLPNGKLFYIAMVSPEDESSKYKSAFSNVIRSIRFYPGEADKKMENRKSGNLILEVEKIGPGRTPYEKMYQFTLPANQWAETSIKIKPNQEVNIHHFMSNERVTVRLGGLNDSRLQQPGTILPLYTSTNCSTDRGVQARVRYTCVQLSRPESIKLFARQSISVGIYISDR